MAVNTRSWNIFDRVVEAIEDGVDDGVKQAARDELDAAEEAYDREETVLGTPWKPLSPVTIARKGHDTILVEEGDMRDSGFVEERSDSVRVGFSDWKVSIHEFGTEDIPPRPIVGPMRLDLKHDRLEHTVAESVEESIKSLPSVNVK
ncbi:phage virion morphogenesis protein [Halocatena halophila]|uniref:phage virion morphogenesis protein n=1 Tax=Halocatena halophila TaxID=2814576 RepID=UPI002ED2F7BA